MARTRLKGPEQISLRSLPAGALRAVLAEGYSLADLRRDAMAGVVVGVVALPLSMALSIAVGAPPQNGLYTAIVAGFLVAALGGSRTQVTGPTAAFIVILAPIYARLGMSGLLMAGVLAGLLLLGMGLLRLGRFIEFIPHPVTSGFTAGIGTVIALLQLKDLLGLSWSGNPQHVHERVALMWESRGTFSGWELGIGLFTLGVLILFPRVTKRVPAPLVALPVAAVVVAVLTHFVPGVSLATIATRFHSEAGGVSVSGIPRLPPMPLLPWRQPGAPGAELHLSFATFRELLPSAFAIAMLGAIESLLSAVVSDGMARTRHDPDAELLGLGIGNLVAPFFCGIPATGAIARTATNIRSGARSPFAAMTHALTVLAAVLVLAPLIGYLPMASLAALLLLVAWNMSEAKHFVHVVRVAPKPDVAVLLTCYGLTVAFDMVVAVTAGMVLAAFLFMKRMADVTHARLGEGHHAELPRALPPGVLVYDIDGPLFFGAAQKAMSALHTVERAKAVIFRMDGVPVMDATGLVAFESALAKLSKDRVLAVLCGVQAQPRTVLERGGIRPKPGELEFCDGIGRAMDLVGAHLG
jgi:SulP family sulfate permease